MEVWTLGAVALEPAYAAGELSPVAVVEACLERIGQLDPLIGAFTFVDPDAARAAAAESGEHLRAGAPRSALEGVPFAVKEIFAVAGWPHTGGSLAFADRAAATDSEMVRRLRAGGAIPVGLTRTHELAMGVTTQHESRGSTRNPWDLERVPGGSSGGSAAAVAAGMVPLALGSDTSGSVRIPAAFCGVTGVRPSHGRLPLEGAYPLATSYDTAGLLAREVEDLEMGMAITDPGFVADSRPGLDGLTVGVPVSPVLPLGAAQEEAVLEAARACERLGARLVDVELPTNGEIDAAVELQRAEMIATHTEVLGTWPQHSASLSSSLRARLGPLVERGADALAGRRATDRIRAAVSALPVDLFVAAVATQPPSRISDPEAGDFRDSTLRSNHLQSVLGAPAVAVPAGIDSGRLPVGVQIWGRPEEDALVLAAARLVRDELRDRLPDLPTWADHVADQ